MTGVSYARFLRSCPPDSKFLLLPARISSPKLDSVRDMYFLSVAAFIFDIDGTLVDSNALHVDSWDDAFRRFGKKFPREKLRSQIGKGSDQYIPEFLTPNEIKRFGKELDEYRSNLFRNKYRPK